MYSLLKLITKSEYWQLLTRKATWSEARLQISRFHKDKRARRYTLGMVALFAAPVVLVLYAAWLIGSGAIFLVPFVIPVLWWRARQQRHDEPLHIAPPAAPVTPELDDQSTQALLKYLVDLTLVHAAIVHRANSEGFLKQKQLPEGVEVISRRVLIDMLKSRGLWDNMSSRDRQVMSMADGHWDWDTINESISKIEEIRLLRWVLSLDPYLPAVGTQLDLPLRLASDIIENPDKLLQPSLRDISDLRIAQHTADVYFLRCFAEGVTRGIFTASNEEIKDWAMEISQTLHGDHNEDLLLDRDLVSQASDELLMRGFERSRQRNLFLKWVISIVEEREPLSVPLSVLSDNPTETID